LLAVRTGTATSGRRTAAVLIALGALACLLLALPGAASAVDDTCDLDCGPDPGPTIEHKTVTLTVVYRGGTVTGSGIDCGATCTKSVQLTRSCDGDVCDDWTTATFDLTASYPRPGFQVTWTGCDTSSGNTCSVTIDADRTVDTSWRDVQPPQGLTLTAPTKVGPTTAISASATDNDTVLGYHWTVDGTARASQASSITIGTLAEGAHTVGVTAVDDSGNATGPVTQSVTLDKSVTVTLGAVPAVTGAATVPMSITWDSDVPNDARHRQCQLNSGPLTHCSAGFSAVDASTPEGDYTYTVYAQDDVGNTTTASRTFAIDRTAPMAVFSGVPGEGATVTTRDVDFAFTVTDLHPGDVACSVDGAAFAACSTATSDFVANLADGPHTLNVRATDAGGNASTIARTFTVKGPSTQNGDPGDNTNRGADQPSTQPEVPTNTAAACVVPALKGMKLGKAKAALKAAGCGVGKVRKKAGKGKPGRVLRQSKKAGKQLPAGTKVALTVSKRKRR
jgi:hypothetical protein